MIFIDKSADRDIQFEQQIKRCYDDYCFYNRIDESVREKYVDEYVDKINKDDLIVPYLPIYITTACTLNCEKCNNLMPMFHGKAFDFSWDKTKKALTTILLKTKEIIFCELVGGEPFLNKDFEKILDYLASEKKIRQIIVVTNGTVMPKESIIKKMHDYKVIVRVSDYGMFERMSSFIATLDKFNVNVRVQQDMKWNDPGGISARGRSREELRKQYNLCEFSLKCKYLCEDKLFTCARAASLFSLGLFESEKDILQISKDTSKEEIKSFYLRNEGDICDYCDLFTTQGVTIPAAVQVGERQLNRSNYTVISNYEFNHYKNITKKYEKYIAKKDVSS